jgi:hypothetical protein
MSVAQRVAEEVAALKKEKGLALTGKDDLREDYFCYAVN